MLSEFLLRGQRQLAVVSSSFSKNPLACSARCTLFWNVESFPGREQPGVVGNRLAQRLDPGTVALGEIRQHVAVHQLLDAGMADPDPHPAIVVADMRRDRAQAVVAGDAAADLDPHLAGGQFELVLEHGDLADRQLEEAGGFLHRAAGFVHEGHRLQQHHPFAIERAFRGLALKAAAPWCETMTPRNFIDGHETDVVPVVRVLRAGIAETNKQSHDAASRVRLLLLVAAQASPPEPWRQPQAPWRQPREPHRPRAQQRRRPPEQHPAAAAAPPAAAAAAALSSSA